MGREIESRVESRESRVELVATMAPAYGGRPYGRKEMAKLNIQAIQDAFHNEMMMRRDSSGKLEFLGMFGVVAGALKKGLKKRGKKETTVISFADIATAAAGIALRKENEKTLADMAAADERQRQNNFELYKSKADGENLPALYEEVADDNAVLNAFACFVSTINGKTFRDNGDRDIDVEFVCDIKLPEEDEDDDNFVFDNVNRKKPLSSWIIFPRQ